MFYQNGTVYDQLLILNSNYEVDPTLLAAQGLPYYAGTWVVYLLTTNLGLAATFTHLLLWNHNDLHKAWSWMSPSNLRRQWREFRWNNFNWRFWNDDGMREQHKGSEDIDPHYAQMLKVGHGLPMIRIADIKLFFIPVSGCPEQLVPCYFRSIFCSGTGGSLQERLHLTMVGLRHIHPLGDYIHPLSWRIVSHYWHQYLDS